LIKSILLIFVVVGIIVIIINGNAVKQLIVKFRGRTEELANRDAMSPEGARDYFNNAIREKEALFSEADKSFAEIAGKLKEREKEEHDLRKSAIGIQNHINACLDNNDEDGAKAWALKLATVNQKLDTLKSVIEEYTKSRDRQEITRKTIESDLIALKEERERTVFQIEADQQVINLHEGLNTYASSNESDKMLEKVREGARKTRERATGAQISYETSEVARDRALEQSARDMEANEILEKAKRQRGIKW